MVSHTYLTAASFHLYILESNTLAILHFYGSTPLDFGFGFFLFYFGVCVFFWGGGVSFF